MNYKKILVATAVTSAAFVAPVIAYAADVLPTEAELFVNTEVQLNEVLTINNTVPDEFKTYEWYIVYKEFEFKLANSTAQLTVPLNATGAKIKLIAKTEDGQAYQDTIDVTSLDSAGVSFEDLSLQTPEQVNEGFVNTPISVDIGLLDETITKYEWYVVKNNNEYHLLADEKDMLIDVPVHASGKTLRLILTTEDGSKYQDDLPIAGLELADDMPIQIKLNDKEITDDMISADGFTLAPNDVLSADGLELMGINGEDILSSQANISYQWYFTGDNGTSSLIPNATNASFTIPADAFYRTMQSFKVLINVEVPDAEVTKSYFSKVITLNIDPAEALEDSINALFENNFKYITTSTSDLSTFEAELTRIQTDYAALSTNSKTIVKNYQKLQEAVKNLQLVKPLIREIDVFNEAKLKYDLEETDLKHANLLKQFTSIEKQYQKLDSLQRSLFELTDYKENYVETMFTHLKNISNLEFNEDTTAKTIKEINESILALFSDATVFSKEYNLADTRQAFLKTVNDLNTKTKTVDKVHQPLLYTSILKTAQSDVKKAESVAVKINKISTLPLAKKVKAAATAHQAYNKLTFLQKSLIAADELKILTDSEQSEAAKIIELINNIKNAVTDDGYNVMDFTFDDVDYTFEGAIDYLLNSYKTLSSTAKKEITNYVALNQAKKDIKLANKVIISIKKAQTSYEQAGDNEKAIKSVLSKYSTAYKAYIKLTPLQRTIIEGSDVNSATFISEYENLSNQLNTPTFDDEDEKADEKFNVDKVESIIILLNDLEASITVSVLPLEDVQKIIEEVKTSYKELTSYEKKLVYNYSVLSTANTVVNKAISVQKKLTTAIASSTESKLSSAIAAYQKLTMPQQLLISDLAEEAISKLENLKPDLSEIEGVFTSLEVEVSIENIKAVTAAIQGLSSKELKQLPQYKLYQEALKTQKAVESFINKMDKLGDNPSYSKKQSILTAYNKLTDAQTTLFTNSYEDRLNTLEAWNSDLNTNAEELNNKIGVLLVSGKYVVADTSVTGTDLAFMESFNMYIKKLEAEYKALDSKEKKLISHSSFLKTATNDAKAVTSVIELALKVDQADTSTKESAFSQWERAFNRLSVSQQSLYEISGTLPKY